MSLTWEKCKLNRALRWCSYLRKNEGGGTSSPSGLHSWGIQAKTELKQEGKPLISEFEGTKKIRDPSSSRQLNTAHSTELEK